jgi:hypothetical protein
MTPDFRRTATCQALVSILIRHLQQRREAILEQVPSCGGPISEEIRFLSNALEQVDEALTQLGLYDMAEGQ